MSFTVRLIEDLKIATVTPGVTSTDAESLIYTVASELQRNRLTAAYISDLIRERLV
ncbi:MAG: hypothetical protein NC212_10940 [Staphylococcus sp.]|nr:hypothetical protein [Staphylococcus sp.]